MDSGEVFSKSLVFARWQGFIQHSNTTLLLKGDHSMRLVGWLVGWSKAS
jgi:hypothetical protein